MNGDAIESLFDYVAMSKGFTVSAPRSNMAQYDRIIDVNNKLFRVQIKGETIVKKGNRVQGLSMTC